MIRENESNRSQCLQLSALTNDIAGKIDFLKEELFELKKQFDKFDANVAQLHSQRLPSNLFDGNGFSRIKAPHFYYLLFILLLIVNCMNEFKDK
jgi:hypothetical protein